MKSVQARAIEPRKLKSVAPVGFSCSGLFFANEPALKFLRGISTPDYLWIVEGEVDYASVAQYDAAVLGIKSGSISAMKEIRWPKDLSLIIATDNDEKGMEYAEQIITAVAPIIPLRVDFSMLERAAGAAL